MFMQLGFRDGLFDTSVTIHKLLDTDLVLISPRSKSSISMRISRRRLIQTLALEEVEDSPRKSKLSSMEKSRKS